MAKYGIYDNLNIGPIESALTFDASGNLILQDDNGIVRKLSDLSVDVLALTGFNDTEITVTISPSSYTPSGDTLDKHLTGIDEEFSQVNDRLNTLETPPTSSSLGFLNKKEQLPVSFEQTSFILSETPIEPAYDNVDVFINGVFVTTYTITGANITWAGADLDGSETWFSKYIYEA